MLGKDFLTATRLLDALSREAEVDNRNLALGRSLDHKRLVGLKLQREGTGTGVGVDDHLALRALLLEGLTLTQGIGQTLCGGVGEEDVEVVALAAAPEVGQLDTLDKRLLLNNGHRSRGVLH